MQYLFAFSLSLIKHTKSVVFFFFLLNNCAALNLFKLFSILYSVFFNIYINFKGVFDLKFLKIILICYVVSLSVPP